MDHHTNLSLSDTAYVTAHCRASMPHISKDCFARLWTTATSERIYRQYIEEVSTWENIAISLRNNFFLTVIKEFFLRNPTGKLVNVACGFSSLPFLLPEDKKYVEVDEAHIIDTKKEKVSYLTAHRKLPKRNIRFLSLNINSPKTVSELFDYILPSNNESVFILFEGIMYYLTNTTVSTIFDNLALLPTGSYVGLNTWPKKLEYMPILGRFKKFFGLSNLNCFDMKPMLLKEYRLHNKMDYNNMCGVEKNQILYEEHTIFIKK